MWAEDRVHLSPAGHRLIATRAAHALRVPYFEIAEVSIPIAHDPARSRLGTFGWLQRHALPWAGRRLRRASTGEGIDPKLPRPSPVTGRG
jgi:hypothetical protein